MSVNVCPECGAEYLATVKVCADDGTELVESDVEELEAQVADEVAHADDLDAAGLDDEADRHGEPGEQIAYDLADWDVQSRVVLAHLLTGAQIVHVWEAATLVVHADHEARVDELVDQVEAQTQPLLDPDKDQAVYELEGWPAEKRDALAESLMEAEIPFGFDENEDLVVHEEDEDRVAPVLDQVDANFALDGDAIAADEGDDEDLNDDGLAAQEALSDLFVAADRLMHDADDRHGVLGMVEGAKAIRTFALPYGFSSAVWANILSQSKALGALLEGDADEEQADDVIPVDEAPAGDAEGDAVDDADDADQADGGDDDEAGHDWAAGAGADDVADETIQSAARELRELLRQYV